MVEDDANDVAQGSRQEPTFPDQPRRDSKLEVAVHLIAQRHSLGGLDVREDLPDREERVRDAAGACVRIRRA